MDLSWADAAQPVVAGLAGILGVWVVEESLRVLRRSGLCPTRWTRERGQGRSRQKILFLDVLPEKVSAEKE